MEIKDDYYSVTFDEEKLMIIFEGTFRLNGTEGYKTITDMLNKVAEEATSQLTVDLTNLQFLNSSGINTLLKFVIRVRDKGTIGLLVKGNEDLSWQKKSLSNLQKLMPDLVLKMV
jgi:hypothetical protein